MRKLILISLSMIMLSTVVLSGCAKEKLGDNNTNNPNNPPVTATNGNNTNNPNNPPVTAGGNNTNNPNNPPVTAGGN